MVLLKAIVNGKIILEDSILSDMVILFDNRIVDIISQGQLEGYKVDEVIDAKGKYVSAGFIDIHTHGAVKHDVMDGTMDALEAISSKLPSFGVTSFLPTTMTMEFNKITEALNVINSCMKNCKGASVLGCNLEGPFISKKYCGAHKPEYIIDPDFSLIEGFKNVIKLLTLAPELHDSEKFIEKCVKENIVVSIGHSDASNDVVKQAIKSGARSTTHTFNAMTPLHHRNPGVIGACLNNDEVYCELIADNIHIHPDIQNILLRAKGIDKIILITDAMRAAGMGKGVYELGGQAVLVDDTSARLENGTLAGSILTINTAIKNFKNNTCISINEAVKTVTVNPAKLLGIYDSKGTLKKGSFADIVIFNDDFEIQNTFVEGSLCYKK
jgi:N-acetylglucosamine-6-phosphate deacetylase